MDASGEFVAFQSPLSLRNMLNLAYIKQYLVVIYLEYLQQLLKMKKKTTTNPLHQLPFYKNKNSTCKSSAMSNTQLNMFMDFQIRRSRECQTHFENNLRYNHYAISGLFSISFDSHFAFWRERHAFLFHLNSIQNYVYVLLHHLAVLKQEIHTKFRKRSVHLLQFP